MAEVEFELGKLQAEIVTVHKRVDAVESGMHKRLDEFFTRLEVIANDVKNIGREPPRLPLILGAVAVVTVILSVLGLVINPIISRQQEHHEALTLHAGNKHPETMLLRVDALRDALAAVHDVHSEADVEQEIDIGELRTALANVDSRDDVAEARLTALEVKVEERTKNFRELLDLRAIDRWTKTQDDDRMVNHAKVMEERVSGLTARLNDVRDLIVRRKGGGFYREDYATIVEPWMRRHDREIQALERIIMDRGYSAIREEQ